MELADEAMLVTDAANRHYGFPRMVRARDGDLLLFYRIGTTHAYDDAVIGMRRSSDDGASWSSERLLREREPGLSAHNPVALVTSRRRIILWASRYRYGPGVRLPCWWSFSDDHGSTWSPWTLFDPSERHSCYYVTDAIRTSDGLLAGDATFPASGVGPCHTRILFSSDDGLTWTCRSKLTPSSENSGDEVALAEVAPGTVLCVQRDRSRADTFRFWSRDGGRTWSDPESIRGMLDCVLQRPFLTRLDEALYLLSGRDYARRRVVTYLSVDGGRTFGQRMELDTFQKDGGYTAVVPLGGRACLIAWYSDSHARPLKPDIKVKKLNV